MNTQITRKWLAYALLFAFIFRLAGTAKADSSSVFASVENAPILFSQLISNDIELVGPYASDGFFFAPPANWRLTGGGYIDLSMTLAFNVPQQNLSDGSYFSAGKLLIELNDVLIGVVGFSQPGSITQQFQIPVEALHSAREDGLFELRFTMDSGWSCELNDSVFLAIHTNSSMVLSYETIIPKTDLADFPVPIYQRNSIYPNSAIVVIPDQPTSSELQSALTVAAGLGNLTSGRLKLDLALVGRLSSEMIAANNLIFVGRASTHPLLSQSEFPLPVQNGQYNSVGGEPDDGIIQMVNSPWNNEKTILLVTGNTDSGTLKAAQAISTGVLRPNTSPNLAIVKEIQNLSLPIISSTDIMLSELGYNDEELTDVGVNYSEFVFYIPSGQTVTEDAYFELHFGHSALLEFERSGIIVRLNGTPIGSVVLTDETAQTPNNRVKFELPASEIITGENVLEVRTNLLPYDKCSPPNFSAVYANIWADSLFHLPLTHAVINPMTNYSLNSYPIPYAYSPALDTTAFVLQRDDIESWRAAFNVAFYLGDRAGGSVVTLMAYYGDEVPDDARAGYNFIILGKPSKLPIVNEINEFLPAPFAANSDIAIEPRMQVDYRLSPQTSVGYVEMLVSPWNKDNIIILAAGDTPQAVVWAASYLIEPQSYKLEGNFAVVNDQKIYTADTRFNTITPDALSTDEAPVVEVLPSAPGSNSDIEYQPAWLLPTLFSTLTVILLTILVVVYRGWSRSRTTRKENIVKRQF